MRLRVLELPMTSRPDGVTYASADAPPEPYTPFVIVLDDLKNEGPPTSSQVASLREATGARGVAVFRERVDIPAADSGWSPDV